MKHATAKTLGVAALGAAFAASAAGSASAMSVNEGLAHATGQVASSVPVEDAVTQVEGDVVRGGTELLTNDAVTGTLGSATETLSHTASKPAAGELLGGLAPGALDTVTGAAGLSQVNGAAGAVTGALGALG
ncbi:hypothetical protein [Streptomyces sp. NBRC 109706]|uniref:hypothetical protein n=1 Tax=Streptomyces sp. NBRC 109706 TaxID=1550035 RepID=UPI0007854893|nr:hypothetical protein [Streptomyces sp. NBRC 109706]